MLKYKLEYLLTRLLGTIAKGLSLKALYFIGDRLGDLLFYIIKSRKKTALTNLKNVFGKNKSEAELLRIVHSNYRHFGKMALEFAQIPRLTPKNIPQEVPVYNQEILHEALAKQKGVIVLSGHFGNWEYLAAAVAQIGPPMYAVFKEQKNLLVDAIIKKYRMDLGLRPLKVKGGAARGIIHVLRSKAKVLILFDQDAGGKGKFVNFLGRPASTTKGPAQIAIKHKIPAVMALSLRSKKGGIKVILEKFPDPEKFSNDEAGIIKFIEEYNKTLEKYIRKYPEQWFWMHRRWLTWERSLVKQ
jgi:Kdo2-lipid IVA lauroyltransferase/acyltransferase